jgi:hypothetical protein
MNTIPGLPRKSSNAKTKDATAAHIKHRHIVR